VWTAAEQANVPRKRTSGMHVCVRRVRVAVLCTCALRGNAAQRKVHCGDQGDTDEHARKVYRHRRGAAVALRCTSRAHGPTHKQRTLGVAAQTNKQIHEERVAESERNIVVIEVRIPSAVWAVRASAMGGCVGSDDK
jgi:hypothetical protein